MNGKAKETAPLFLFTGECVTSEANGRGHPQESASSSWQPFSTPSSAEPVWGTVHPLPLLPRLPPASISTVLLCVTLLLEPKLIPLCLTFWSSLP